MKPTALFTLAISLFAAAPSMAASLTTLNVGFARSLPECGGTVEVKASENAGSSDQVNFILRNVQFCSNFVLHATDKQYKIGGEDGNRSGSFTLSASKMAGGTNIIRLTVRSNSGAHQDEILIPVRVIVQPIVKPAPLCGADFCVGERVINIDRSYATAQIIAVTNDGNYVLRFESGELFGQVGGGWSARALARTSGCNVDFCVGSQVFVLSKVAFATVVGRQLDGNYVLRFDSGELTGLTGGNWSPAALTLMVR